MKLKQSVNLLLIALFVWTFQSTAIHVKQHAMNEVTECNLCEASEKIDLHHQNSPAIVYNEHLETEARKSEEKIVLKSGFDYTDVPQLYLVDMVKNRQYSAEAIPIGFNATAPPHFVS